jgi:hypothetical protein
MTNVLDQVCNYVSRFIVFPNNHSKVTWAAWVLHTHLIDAFRNTPRLIINSATGGCGKSLLVDITALLVKTPMALVSPTPASLYALIDKEHPTLLIDQSDTMFATGRDMSDTIGIIDAGFTRGRKRSKINGETGAVQFYDLFGPLLLAGIDRGNIDSTILDRSIAITLRKNAGPRQVKVEVYRESKHEAEGLALRKRLEDWASTAKSNLRPDPSMPNEITNGRFADKWEPLFAVSDVIDRTENRDIKHGTDRTSGTNITSGLGGMLRRAALDYLKEEQDEAKPDFGELVLRDIYDLFKEDPSKLFYRTFDLLDALARIPEAPWSCFHNNNKPLSDRGLSSLLKPFKIKSKQETTREKLRGYYRSDFEDAFSRHLPDHPSISAVLSVPAIPSDAKPPRMDTAPVAGVPGLHTIRF